MEKNIPWFWGFQASFWCCRISSTVSHSPSNSSRHCWRISIHLLYRRMAIWSTNDINAVSPKRRLWRVKHHLSRWLSILMRSDEAGKSTSCNILQSIRSDEWFQQIANILGGSSHLVSGLVHPSYLRGHCPHLSHWNNQGELTHKNDPWVVHHQVENQPSAGIWSGSQRQSHQCHHDWQWFMPPVYGDDWGMVKTIGLP